MNISLQNVAVGRKCFLVAVSATYNDNSNDDDDDD